MSERKVLNKYYPPDFDPTKIPRMKVKRDGKFGIRLMAPFNMRCNTCGEYIYKGKKFNARKEDVNDEKYLGLYIYRFYIKCPRCIAEIAFKTDPRNTDYELEAGATRNFEALRTAELQAKKEAEEKEAEEKNNPMKVLENRTKASLQEMDMIETLEELRELRQQQGGVSLEAVLEVNERQARELEQRRIEREQEEDEEFVRSVFSKEGGQIVRRLDSDDDDDDESSTVLTKKPKLVEKATDFLTSDSLSQTKQNGVCSTSSAAPSTSAKTCSLRQSLLKGVIVRPKKPAAASSATSNSVDSTSSLHQVSGTSGRQAASTSSPLDCVQATNSCSNSSSVQATSSCSDGAGCVKRSGVVAESSRVKSPVVAGSIGLVSGTGVTTSGAGGLVGLGCYGSSDSDND